MTAYDHLNPKQVARLTQAVNDPEIGGFTVATHGEARGGVPATVRDSYVVGQARYGENNITAPAKQSDLQHFLQTRKEPLQQEGRYLGGWNNTAEGKVALDVVRAYPRDQRGLTEATFSGLVQGEDAIGSFKPNGQYDTDIDPYEAWAKPAFEGTPVRETKA